MTYPAPFTASLVTIDPAWTNSSGHLTMGWAGILFDRAADEFFALAGFGPDYLKSANCTYFILETHLTLISEIPAGTVVRIDNQIVDYDAKRMHYVQQMYHAGEGWLGWVAEFMGMHMDLGLKKAVPMPPAMQAKVAAIAEAHKSLPIPPQKGHVIGLPGNG